MFAYIVMQSTRNSCHILTKLEFSPQILEKILKYQISRTSVEWKPVCFMWTDGGTGGQKKADMKKLIFAFRNLANAPKMGLKSYLRSQHTTQPWHRITALRGLIFCLCRLVPVIFKSSRTRYRFKLHR